jgi:hypothetical protein
MEKVDLQDSDLENTDEQDEREVVVPEGEPESKPEGKSEREVALEAELAKTKRLLAKAKKTTPAAPQSDDGSQKTEKSGELGYGEKAFLRAYDIKGSEELALVRQFQDRGFSLDSIVEDDVFTAKLTKLREAKAAQDAVPSTTRRASQPPADDVEQWIAKGELPPNDPANVELRRKVLNERIRRESIGSRFSDNSVVNA